MALALVSDGAEQAPTGGAPPPPPQRDDDDRPTIRMAAGELPRIVEDSVAALALGGTNVYQRSGELCTLTREPDRAEPHDQSAEDDAFAERRRGRDILMRPGTPRIRQLSSAVLCEHMARVARWERWDARRGPKGAKGEWTEADPPQKLAVLLAARGDWPGVRPLQGIRETPFLAPSGRVVTRAGYDEETGFVLLPSVDVGEIADRPTKEDAARALRFLWTECFVDFPYRGLGESRNSTDDVAAHERYQRARSCPDAFVAVAAMLTVIARGAIQGPVVAAAFEAASQGSGKTKQMHAAALVTTGRAAGTAAYPMGRDNRTNDEEMSKTLGAYARAGNAIVAFDNVRGEIGGGALEGAMTAEDRAPFRLLGTNDVVELPWSAVLLFSGNNMIMSEDVAQRALLSRLESEREDPRSRPPTEFRHPNLLAWIRQERRRLVKACLVILRAFVVAEDKPATGTVGSFEAWSALIPGAIVYAGGPNIIDARPKGGSSDNGESAAHTAVMRAWPTALYPEGLRSLDLVRVAYEYEHEIAQGTHPPDGLDELRDALRELTNTSAGRVPSAHAVGSSALRALRDRWRDGMKLVGERDRRGVVKWRVVRRDGPAPPLPGMSSEPDPAEAFDR